MPTYESELPHEEMQKVVDKGCVCLECGGLFTIAWGGFYGHDEYMLRCGNDHKHNGIARDASLSPYEIPGFNLFNLNKGRKKMVEQQVGKEVGTKLAKYMGVVSLTKPQAKEILEAVFPEAPASEITRAMILCANYGLNPLMKHVFLIPFNKGKANESWVTVLGIKAKRLLASRRGPYSYIDDTPRVMTDAEQKLKFGKVEPDKLWVITKGRDPATGAEASGVGFWPKNKEPYGTDKGNTAFNMASIRSESQMTDKLRPGEMPEGIEVVPEEMVEGVIEGEYKVVEDETQAAAARQILKDGGDLKDGTYLGTLDGKPIYYGYKGPGKTNKIEGDREAAESPADVRAREEEEKHWCAEHNCEYSKRTGRGNLIFYSHKVGDDWCNEKKKATASKKESPAPAPEPKPSGESEKRDPSTITTITELYKACNTDFKLQPEQVIKELGVKSQTDISDTPEECYRKIAAVR